MGFAVMGRHRPDVPLVIEKQVPVRLAHRGDLARDDKASKVLGSHPFATIGRKDGAPGSGFITSVREKNLPLPTDLDHLLASAEDEV